jgi:flagellar basal body-associated protein FliL
MADENPDEAGQVTEKSSGKKWLFIGLAIFFLLGAAGGAFYFFGSSPPAEEPEAENSALPPDLVNDVLELEPLVVNLADDSDIRYARIGISLGIASSNPGEELLQGGLLIPKLRDHCLFLFGQKTSQELLTPEVKETTRADLIAFINEDLDPEKGRVIEVYFTEFIIQ